LKTYIFLAHITPILDHIITSSPCHHAQVYISLPAQIIVSGRVIFYQTITPSGRAIFSRSAVLVIISLASRNRARMSFIAPQVNSLFNWLGRRSVKDKAELFNGRSRQPNVAQGRHIFGGAARQKKTLGHIHNASKKRAPSGYFFYLRRSNAHAMQVIVNGVSAS
jgi:hypothetical protein